MAKTLDLIKSVLQPSLNMEVKRLCDSYRNIFDMAASNINENTGDTVPSSTLQMLIVKMLEEVRLGEGRTSRFHLGRRAQFCHHLHF